MTRIHKTHPTAHFKALDSKAGTFTALVSVFSNVDYQGDRVLPGAFTKSIQRWQQNSAPLPIIWSHDWQDPFAHIGYVDPQNMRETTDGLEVTGKLDIDKPFAKQVYDLLAQRRVREWSFGYDVLREQPGRDMANELVELDIIEAGPTLKGANSLTQTLDVKAADPDTVAVHDVLVKAYEMSRFTPTKEDIAAAEAYVKELRERWRERETEDVLADLVERYDPVPDLMKKFDPVIVDRAFGITETQEAARRRAAKERLEKESHAVSMAPPERVLVDSTGRIVAGDSVERERAKAADERAAAAAREREREREARDPTRTDVDAWRPPERRER